MVADAAAAARRRDDDHAALVCASANPDKVAEIAASCSAGAVELLPRPADVPDVVEDADTLDGNARLKAVAIMRGDRVCRPSPTTPGWRSTPSAAQPGVYTARYAGEGCSLRRQPGASCSPNSPV